MYCFTKALFGSVKILTKSSTDRSSNSTRIGKRPCNSAIKSLGLLSWKAPEPMNKMWSVLTKPYLVEI